MTKSFPGYPVSRTINVSDIKCSSCEKTITDSLMNLDGVFEVKPDHETGKVDVTYDLQKIQLGIVEEKLASIGFPLVRSFWARCKRGLDHFKEQNESDNMTHVPHCCNKPPARG